MVFSILTALTVSLFSDAKLKNAEQEKDRHSANAVNPINIFFTFHHLANLYARTRFLMHKDRTGIGTVLSNRISVRIR